MKRRTLILSSLAVLLAGAIAWVGTSSPTAVGDHHELGARIFEMRTYYTNDGKLDALHARFRNHTNHLFVKHGMTLVGYWTPVDKKETLVYILGYSNMDARKKAWNGFLNDPVWKKAYKESTADGKLVKKIDSEFLNPTDYSPIR